MLVLTLTLTLTLIQILREQSHLMKPLARQKHVMAATSHHCSKLCVYYVDGLFQYDLFDAV